MKSTLSVVSHVKFAFLGRVVELYTMNNRVYEVKCVQRYAVAIGILQD